MLRKSCSNRVFVARAQQFDFFASLARMKEHCYQYRLDTHFLLGGDSMKILQANKSLILLFLFAMSALPLKAETHSTPDDLFWGRAKYMTAVGLFGAADCAIIGYIVAWSLFGPEWRPTEKIVAASAVLGAILGAAAGNNIFDLRNEEHLLLRNQLLGIEGSQILLDDAVSYEKKVEWCQANAEKLKPIIYYKDMKRFREAVLRICKDQS